MNPPDPHPTQESPPAGEGGAAPLRTAALVASAALLAAPLLSHAYVGLFARYMADDYCTAAALRVSGLLGMQRRFYVEWSGRFSFTLTAGVVELFGASVVPYLPSALLALWLAALAWAASQFGVGRLKALVLAELVAFATLDDNRNGVYEALYWQTGSLTYLLPLVLLAALAGYMARARRRGEVGAPSLFACGAVALYAGGFSETFALMQAALFASALAARALPRDPFGVGEGARRLQKAFASALAGSLLALAVIALAPGNGARRAALPPPRPPARAALAAAGDALAFTFTEHNYPATAHFRLAAFLAPLLLSFFAAGAGERAVRPRVMLTILAAAFVLIYACFLPSEYALSGSPPPRALLTPQFVLVSALAALGYLSGLALRRVVAEPTRAAVALSALLAAALAAAPLLASRSTLAKAPKARKLAAVWDRQDALTRAAVARGERRLTLPVLYNIGGTDLMTGDPRWYVNACVAGYYGAESVTATPGGEGQKVMFGED